MKFDLLNIVIVSLLTNLLNLRSLFKQNEKCKKFVCTEDLSYETCLNLQDDTIFMKKCNRDSEEICPIMKKSQGELKCEPRSDFKNQRSFPGGKCYLDAECIYGSCENNFCKGKNLGDACDGHNQCPYKSSCKLNQDTNSKVCTPLSQEGGSCTDDFDCMNNLGCHMGKCINYLSLPLGTKIDNSIRNVFSLCDSGFAYKGVCDSLKNKYEGPTKCDSDNQSGCFYTNNNGEEIEIKELCLCGKNTQGIRFCALGNNSSAWGEYLDALKIVLSFNFENCNTLERTMCRNAIQNNKSEYEKFIISSITATRQHELNGADNCVLDIFFPMLNRSNRKILQSRINNFNSNKINANITIEKAFLKK